MSIALIVTQPFASYARGDRITDHDTVQKVLADHPHSVVKTEVKDEAPAKG